MTQTIDTTATTEETKTTSPEPDYVVENAARALVGVGALWARYGLGVGRAALETSAATLRATSELLRTVSERLDADAPKAEPTK